ncbi:terminase small subunit [Microbacterium esteraromaticum]|uniref:terminase small subunit n=1 Tax=Microbacterium esteraromaticum TaxID=57043 RepID=UPI0019D39406|nr:hypothetical protein [Microbacterium esteraromaticum]MBN7792419.1 hypothetical protein [Microbacterium esteraromaticum]
MTKFEQQGVVEALERSIKNSKHLRARHSAAIAAARALARKIDAWDVIVEWALDDAAQSKGRPAVPANDNVSIASFLKYLDALGLMPEDEEPVATRGRPASRPPAAGAVPAPSSNKVLAFRKKAASG